MVTDQELETVPITEQHIDNNSEDEVLSQISQPLHFPSTLHIPHPSWRPHVPKPIQHTPYDADEVVWIKNKPVPANDVEEADGGSLTVGLQQTSKHQFGNPAPLGLCAFGLSCFLTSLFKYVAIFFFIMNYHFNSFYVQKCLIRYIISNNNNDITIW